MVNRRIAAWMMVFCMWMGGCATGPVVDPAAKPEKVATGYKFTEGPAVDKAGNVYFSDIPNNAILKFDVATDKASVFRADSGRSNGLMFDAKGDLVACESARRRIARIPMNRAKPSIEASAGPAAGILAPAENAADAVLAGNYMGDRFNSPNDLEIDAKGGVYFTDPRYGPRDDMEMTVEGVYYISPTGQVTRVIEDLQRPNGLILSKDGRILYVADNAAQTIVAYDVKADGTLAGKRLFAEMDKTKKGGPDGMTLDERGNVYAAGQDGVFIWDPTGKLITKIIFPEGPANCVFAGKDRNVLYVTARTSLYRIKMNVRGIK